MYKNGKNITFIDRSVSSVNNYLKDISKSAPLITEKEYDLWLRMQQGSKHAREQLILANLRYVVSVAKKYLYSGATLEDLIQSGNEGLVKAVDKFDASLGYRLISFATWYIENEIRKTAYDHIRHHHTSLDEPINTEDGQDESRVNFLTAYQCQSADWNQQYNDTLIHLKAQVDKRQHGLGQLTGDLHHMLCNGYSTSDFARKHHLNDQQMDCLLNILRSEAIPQRQAA